MTLTTLLFLFCQPTECLVMSQPDGLYVFSRSVTEVHTVEVDGSEVTFMPKHDPRYYKSEMLGL